MLHPYTALHRAHLHLAGYILLFGGLVWLQVFLNGALLFTAISASRSSVALASITLANLTEPVTFGVWGSCFLGTCRSDWNTTLAQLLAPNVSTTSALITSGAPFSPSWLHALQGLHLTTFLLSLLSSILALAFPIFGWGKLLALFIGFDTLAIDFTAFYNLFNTILSLQPAAVVSYTPLFFLQITSLLLQLLYLRFFLHFAKDPLTVVFEKLEVWAKRSNLLTEEILRGRAGLAREPDDDWEEAEFDVEKMGLARGGTGYGAVESGERGDV